jgi:hypothetical protein
MIARIKCEVVVNEYFDIPELIYEKAVYTRWELPERIFNAPIDIEVIFNDGGGGLLPEDDELVYSNVYQDGNYIYEAIQEFPFVEPPLEATLLKITFDEDVVQGTYVNIPNNALY